MPLPAGVRVGPYEIVAPIGHGGMGEVYRARDTRLDRTVAIKVLTQSLATETEFRIRFEREARAIAALNHPHICALHDVGPDYLVMEYIDGVPLRGPMPVREALRLAVQITDALDAAHRHGITHRDLKPGNILVTKAGVKLLDFGLAKRTAGEMVVGSAADALTASSDLTRQGTILGTPQYMAPEQLEGKEADSRADIFAFGCVLYQIITGRPAFDGTSVAAIVASILQTEPPPLSMFQPASPPSLDRLVTRCLAKDPDERWQTARDLRAELEWIATAQGQSALRPARSKMARTILLSVGGLALLAAGSVAGLWLRRPELPSDPPVRRFIFRADSSVGYAAISPDGRYIAYTTPPDETLWIQDLERDEPRRLVTAGFNRFPFWSPDSAFVAFRSGERSISKVSIHGGPVVPVCDTPALAYEQPAWSPDGRWIVFAGGSPSRLYVVPPGGGMPKFLFEPDASESAVGFQNAHFLPNDGQHQRLLFEMNSGADSRIAVQDIDTGRRTALGSGRRPFYSFTGHVLYESSGDLWAMPFSVRGLERTGETFPVLQSTSTASVASDGTLVYVAAEGGLEQLIWRNRKGTKVRSVGQPQTRIELPRLSPDGNRVVAHAREKSSSSQVWVHDLIRGSKTPLTSHPSTHDRPIWTPKGDAITFTSARNGNPDIFVQPIDSGSEPQVLVATPDGDYPYDWSSDGKYLVFARCGVDCNLWYLRRNDGQGPPDLQSFVTTPYDDFAPALSPDGRYLAYTSNESGRPEVYVQRFPEGGGKKPISTNGGVGPRWRKDAKELFYTEGDWIVAVSITLGPTVSAGQPKRLFQDKDRFRTRSLRYDVTPDGQLFLFPEVVEEPRPAIRVVQNWFSGFRQGRQSSGRDN